MEVGLAMMAKKRFKKKPNVPDASDTSEARRKRSEELRSRRGRSASIVTGGGGLSSDSTLGGTSLLGSI
jgi:hypothetical protein